jgi:hypothetical protein
MYSNKGGGLLKNGVKIKVFNRSIVIYVWSLAIIICLYFLVRSNISDKKPTRLIEMLGRDSKVELVSIQGTYITDNLGNTTEKVISTITDKDEINQLIFEVNKYEFKFIDNTKLPEVKMTKDNGALQGLTFRFSVNNSQNEHVLANILCYFPKNYVDVDVVKSLRGSGYKTVYGGTSIDENLLNYLESRYSK